MEVGAEVAALIDARLATVEGYTPGAAKKFVDRSASSNTKCRLICYHPYADAAEVESCGQMWAAPHLDTGALTGLVPGAFLGPDGSVRRSAPDSKAGLYVVDRGGNARKMAPPKGEVLFYQLGEC